MEMPDISTAALTYARRGWPIVLLKGKRPIQRDWPSKATTDEAAILAQLAKFPEANIGIATGPRSGFFVLDIDGPQGEESLAQLVAKHGDLPATLEARTGGGGRHILFRYPEGLDLGNSAKQLQAEAGPKLDIRGNGGQIVAAPSVHPETGALYEWASDPETTAIAEAPAWLLELLTRPEVVEAPARPAAQIVNIGDERARKYGLGALESAARELASCGQGGRNQELNRAAFKVAQLAHATGITEEQAESVLLEAAAACGLLKDDGLAQCQKTFRSGWKRGVNNPRELPESNRQASAAPAPAPAADEFEDLVDDYESRLEEDLDEEHEELGGGDGGDGCDSPHVITIEGGELDRIVDQAEAALIARGVQVYRRGGILVRPIRETSMTVKGITRRGGSLVMKELEEAWLVEAFTKAATWRKWDGRKQDYRYVDCPAIVARTYLARAGHWNVPPLLGVIEAPTLRPDGTILDQPGYDPQTGLLFDPGPVEFEPIPASPSRADALAALEEITAVLAGFPFEQPHDQTIAIAAILTGLVRRSLTGAPMFAFNAPKMGSGKSLLADCVSLFATGRRASVMTPSVNEEEEAKRVLGVLMEGDPVIVIDNVSEPLQSDVLCSVLTQEVFKARVLGGNKMASAPTSVTWLVTGNNLRFIGDLTTRVLRCDLDPQTERPEERRFDINLHEYIPEHRPRLVRAALTVLRAYEVAERPKQNLPQYGRFEAWSDWVRSALVWLGLADPCLSRADLEASDTVRTSLVAVLSAWYEAFGQLRMTAQDVVHQSNLPEHSDLKAALLEVASKGSDVDARRLGKWLKKFEKRIEGGYKLLTDGDHKRATYWKVIKAGVSITSNTSLFPSHVENSQEEDHVISHDWAETDSANSANSPDAGEHEEGDA